MSENCKTFGELKVGDCVYVVTITGTISKEQVNNIISKGKKQVRMNISNFHRTQFNVDESYFYNENEFDAIVAISKTRAIGLAVKMFDKIQSEIDSKQKVLNQNKEKFYTILDTLD